MALRVALPRVATDEQFVPTDAARVRQRSLAAYLQLDPAIRFLIALALVTAISLLYLVQTSSVTELNYDVQKLQSEHTTQVQTQQHLQLEIAQAQSLAHVHNVAVNQLHMVPVGDQYTYLAVPPSAPAVGAAVAPPVAPAAGDAAVVVPPGGASPPVAAGSKPEGGGASP